MQKNTIGEDDDRSFINSFFKDMVPPLMPGKSLDAMNRIMTQCVAQSIDELMQDGAARINLSTWLRHHITIATTNATYGPANPFLDQHIEDAFWTFEKNLLPVLINILPSLTASTAIRARKIVSDAFLYYFRKNKHVQGSALVQARVDNAREYGLPIEDIAGFEVGGAIAVLVNTYPTAFWMIYYIIDITVGLIVPSAASSAKIYRSIRPELVSNYFFSTLRSRHKAGAAKGEHRVQGRDELALYSITTSSGYKGLGSISTHGNVQEEHGLDDRWCGTKIIDPERVPEVSRA